MQNKDNIPAFVHFVRGRALATVLFWFVATLLPFQVEAASEPGEKAARVLYLNSYHRGYSWSDDIEQSLVDGLKAFRGKVELSIEYLDSRRFGMAKQENHIARLMEEKYAEHAFDVIVTSDNVAFDFAVTHRRQLFPDAPIVFCGFNNLRMDVLEGIENITGVNEEVDLSGTIDLALSVHPDVRTLAFVVSTRDASSKRIFEIAEDSVFPLYRDKFDVVLLKDLPLKDIEARLKQLSRNTVLFIAGQTSDRGTGRELSPVENSRLITSISPFPVYGFWSFNIGAGVIGGSIMSGANQGWAAAEMVVQVLSGTPAESIPPLFQSPTSLIFDYQVMNQHGVSENRLPANSTIINRPDSLWDRYRYQIIAGILAFVIETLLVIWLFLAVNQRKRALRQTEESLALAERSQIELRQEVVERQNAEKKLRNAEKMQALGTLAGGIAHNFNNALVPIRALSELLMIQLPKESPDHEMLDEIVGGAKRAQDLVAQIMSFSRQDEAKLENIDPCELLRSSMALLRPIAPSNVKIVEHLDKDVGEVRADKAQIESVFMNLASNAFDAMDGKQGELAISLSQIELEKNVTVSDADLEAGGYAKFQFSDTGAGMDEECMKRIFDPFFTTKEVGRGTGLGLSTVHGIVSSYGGTVEVTSELGVGTTFDIYLPLVATNVENEVSARGD